jgi:hypothetical protein
MKGKSKASRLVEFDRDCAKGPTRCRRKSNKILKKRRNAIDRRDNKKDTADRI